MDATRKSWEKFLQPGSLRGNLIVISLLILAFEMFKDSVISKPKTFFSSGFNENGIIVDEEYKSEVLTKSKSHLYASLLWFKQMGAIDGADIEIFDRIRKHRNEVTHELLSYVTDANRNFETERFQELIVLLSKIEKWWLDNVEIVNNPDMVPENTDPGEVITGTIWGLQIIMDIALGNEPEKGFYYSEFTKGHD